MDLKKMMEQAQEMQGRMSALQAELANKRFEASAGGGMVTVVATGDLRIVEIRIEPSVFGQEDREMIEDLTRSAVNAALTNAQSHVQQEMQKMSQQGLGGLFGGGNPFGGGH